MPAVYFLLPSEENVAVICQDLGSALYESYYLNFVSALNRPRLEDLATASVQHGCVAQVHRVSSHENRWFAELVSSDAKQQRRQFEHCSNLLLKSFLLLICHGKHFWVFSQDRRDDPVTFYYYLYLLISPCRMCIDIVG